MRFGVTPVPIPNTTVKTKTAESTILATVWEDRWLPDYKKKLVSLLSKRYVKTSFCHPATASLIHVHKLLLMYASVQRSYL